MDSGIVGVRRTAVLALPGALSVRDRTEPCVRRVGKGWRGGREMEVEQEEGQPGGLECWGRYLCSSGYKKGSSGGS